MRAARHPPGSLKEQEVTEPAANQEPEAFRIILPVELAVRLSQPLQRRFVAALQTIMEVNQYVVHLHVLVQCDLQIPADTRSGRHGRYALAARALQCQRTPAGGDDSADVTVANSSC